MKTWYRPLLAWWFLSHRADFYADFACFCQNKLSFWAVLSFFYERASQSQYLLSLVYQEMLLSLKRGSLSMAISAYVPAMESAMLYACESANALPEGLQYLAYIVKQVSALRWRCYQMMMKNLLPVVIVVFLQMGFYYFVVPIVIKVVPLSQWSWDSYFLYVISEEVVRHVLLFVLVIVLTLLCLFFFLPRWQPSPSRRFCDRYMPFFRMYRQFHAYALLIALSHLLSIRVSLLEALVLLKKQRSPWIVAYLNQIIDRLSYCSHQYGKAFEVGLFDPYVENRLVFAAEQDCFSETLIHLGKTEHAFLLERIYRSIDRVHSTWMMFFSSLIVLNFLGFYSAIFLLQTNLSP